jgi:ParB/RepB/Spo0J family partition protein
MHRKLENIPLNKTCSESSSRTPRNFIDNGIVDLKESIRSLGLIQPITVYHNSATGCYEVLSGYRRIKAYVALNEENPNEGYDTIKAIIMDEPTTEGLKKAISLAEGLTQVPMETTDVVKAVTDLYNTCRDYDIVQQEFGLTRYMIKKFVRLARLPERLVQAINEGEICPNTKAAENAAIRAVDALNWQKDGDVEVEDVVKFAKEIAKGEIQKESLEEEAKNGGNISEIKSRASKKSVKELNKLKLSEDVCDRIEEIAKSMNMDPTKLLMDAINDIYSKYKKGLS